jgi:hypothetical protein
VWTAPLLTSGLFVLAAFFVRAAVAASARVEPAPALAILAALVIAVLAGRTIILWTATGGLIRAALLVFMQTSLLSQILFPVVCHFYSSPLLSQ